MCMMIIRYTHGCREDVAAASNLAHRELEMVLVRSIVVKVVTEVRYGCIV